MSSFLAKVGGVVALTLLLAVTSSTFAQDEEASSESDDDALELQDVKVTGSRLSRPPSELSGNLIVLDRDHIRASGELTLAQVLRQLPQNINATNETNATGEGASLLNGAQNITGASTVNLRGLGSESTLILVDGRRVGYSGLLGGVTDISTIPLSMVERIEILLDGASAIYGSDAVGGVVNIITRKDYSGVEMSINHTRPDRSGFDKTLASLSSGWAWEGGRVNLGVEHFRDSGLDASRRDSAIRSDRFLTTGQKNTEPGPQQRIYSWFFDDSCNEGRAIVWGLDGNVITRDAYAALSDADKMRATCHSDITLPLGFMPSDDLNSISLFGEQEWGDESELGYSLTPEQRSNVINIGIDQDITESIRGHANVRFVKKDSTSEFGVNQQSVTLHAMSPYNPFGRQVTVAGLLTGTPPLVSESEESSLYLAFGAEGSIGTWKWEAEFSHSEKEVDTARFNWFDSGPYGRGVNSDGVSEALIARFGASFGTPIDEPGCQAKLDEIGGTRYTYSVFFGRATCNIYGAPPDPINPFGDPSPWIGDDLQSGSTNEQTLFEALVRGELLTMPGGAVGLVAGYDYKEDVLDSFSEFILRNILSSSSATGNSQFNTRVSRENHGIFAESLIPIVGPNNAMPGIQRLNITLTGRYDSYSNADVEYRNTGYSEGGSLDASDPGDEFTTGVGIVYRPMDALLVKAAMNTSFVAPQLNQLLSKVAQVEGQLSHYVPGGNGAIGPVSGAMVVTNRGGNDKLSPETADNFGVTLEWTPAFIPGLLLKAGWSDTEFKDRIGRLRTSIVYLDDLPATVTFHPEDNTYVIDDRYINIASVERTGYDLELRYDLNVGLNEFSIIARRGYTEKFEQRRSPDSEVVHDLVTTRDDRGSEDASLSPVPEHQTNMQLIWSRGGWFASLDMQAAAKTRIQRTDTFEYITEPATNYDLVLGYEFGSDTFFDAPDLLDGLTMTLTVNNLTDSFADNSSYNPETGEKRQYLVNSFYEWTQGRSYNLSLRYSL